jgi:hypothetical protein
VIRQGEPLTAITFESIEARSTFEDATRSAMNDDANESHSSLGIPFLVGLQCSKTVSPNAIRNDVAIRFDLNGDRHISDHEAAVQRGDSQ